jgi:hypothetical protein
MSEAINMHKRIAMMGESEANHLKKGGKVKKYAKGGAVMSEKGVANLPARSSAPPPLPKPVPHAIATLKKGGKAPSRKGVGLTVAIAVPMRKASGRGR